MSFLNKLAILKLLRLWFIHWERTCNSIKLKTLINSLLWSYYSLIHSPNISLHPFITCLFRFHHVSLIPDIHWFSSWASLRWHSCVLLNELWELPLRCLFNIVKWLFWLDIRLCSLIIAYLLLIKLLTYYPSLPYLLKCWLRIINFILYNSPSSFYFYIWDV
jgi:hypothetical protein